jgi:uncharacterized protein (TIGR02996 family)
VVKIMDNDLIIYGGRCWSITEVNGDGLLKPEPHGLRVSLSALLSGSRGPSSIYGVAGGRLWLTAFHIDFDEETAEAARRGEGPPLFGILPKYSGPEGRFVYDGLCEATPFTGGLLLGAERLEGYRGSRVSWGYLRAYALFFEEGRLIKEEDWSEEMARFRQELAQRPPMGSWLGPAIADGHWLNPRNGPALLAAMMRALAGDACISFEGCPLCDQLFAIPGATDQETKVLKRHIPVPPALRPSREFIVLPLEPDTIRPILAGVLPQGRSPRETIEHVQIEKAGRLELGAYNFFDPRYTGTGPAVPETLLAELRAKGVLRSFESAPAREPAELQAFLASIADHPDDDAVRLIFGDWLTERDDPRGELIRVQCELARQPEDDLRREQLEEHEQQLLDQHGDDWRDAPPRFVHVAFERGLLVVVTTFHPDLAEEQVASWWERQRGWVSRLSLSVANAELPRVAAEKRWAHAPTLDLRVRGGGEVGPELASLAGLAQLRELDLSGSEVTEGGLTALAELTQIRALDLHGTRVTDTGLQALNRLVKVRELNLSNTLVGDAGLAALAGLTQLQELDLSDTAVTDRGLEELNRFQQLQRLFLRNIPVTAVGMRHLAGLDQLRALDLLKTGVTDAGLAELARLIQVRALGLIGTAVTDAGLRALFGLARLRNLYLSSTRVTDAGLAGLRELPCLRGLDLSRTAVSDAGLHAVAGLSQLRELGLWYTAVTDTGLKELTRLPRLRSLALRGCRVTDAELRALGGLTQLRKLDLSHTPVTDEGLHALAGLTQLRELDLSHSPVTGAGLAPVARLTQLRKLNLNSTAVTDVELGMLRRELPRCEI